MKKKTGFLIYLFVAMGLLLLVINSCKKDDSGIPVETVKDMDGNIYDTVIIGTQTWMVENLKTTKYNDGSSIPLVTDAGAWLGLSTPCYCWTNNDISNKPTYGALYNWAAVNTAKLAPTGWHVPTDAEWTQLIEYLGGEAVAGGKLKEAGFVHWNSDNMGATNSSGFTALPGGCRNIDGSFFAIGFYGYWWSSSAFGTYSAWGRDLNPSFSNVGREGQSKLSGFSVRCVKD